ncbi:exopolysaccharide biosynthesis protein [Mesorhizobium sp. CAU 1732]|uniref:exopolysaccharide biosynthesis protein n=1 Tax=Mesorhizobium sp. CAU 1732 TaxID=3140358 RepID=UPI003260A9C3
MSVAYDDRAESMKSALQRTIDMIDDKGVTLRQMLAEIGDHGPLLLCALLTVPFLLPVSIPGVSTVFGLAIILLGFAVALNRTPWLPSRLMDRSIDGGKLRSVLERGVSLIDRIEGVIRPRAKAITGSGFAGRVNGLAIVAGGVLLLFPLGLVPFSNTLPAFAILFLCIGMSQRDGYLVLAGYGMLAATVVYFSVLGYAAITAGRGLASMFGG